MGVLSGQLEQNAGGTISAACRFGSVHRDFFGHGGLCRGQFRVGNQTVGCKRTVGAGHVVRHEELGIFLQAGDHADMGLLHVKVERTRYRVFAG